MAESSDHKDEEPIDVEFTSAEPADVEQPSSGGGPGWISLISVGVVAALAGGAIGVVAGGSGGRYAQASEVELDISKLAEADRALKAELTQAGDSLRNVEVRLKSVVDNNETSDAELSDTLQNLTSEFTALKTAYLALVGGQPDTEKTDETDKTNTDPDTNTTNADDTKVAPLPKAEISLAGLVERLEAIESLGKDPSSGASKDLVKTVSALQQRTTDLEKADVQLNETLKARETLLTTLSTEVEVLEKSLDDAKRSISKNNDELIKHQTKSQQTQDELSASLEALRKVVNERLSTLEGAKITKDEEALIRRADRILALSTLETAIRSGQPFQEELEALALQLPANGRITALRKFSSVGVPTADQLQKELAALKPKVAKAGVPDQPAGQWAWLGDILSSVVTVKEEGSAGGKTASKKVETAISLLSADDLPGAITELKTIEGEAGKLVGVWIMDAERRVKSDSLLERLRNDVVNLEDIK